MGTFSYTTKQTELLSQRDEKLGAFISQVGHIERLIFDDVFEGLCYNIVNQQLSMKACETLWGKLLTELCSVTPATCTDADRLKSCGLSQSKADCIAECSRLFSEGKLTAQKLKVMDDSEVLETLTKVKGIGRWTAEMTLIFCLARPDVLSLSDFGIRKGLSLLHEIDIKDIKSMEKYKEVYSPFGTVASFYLWEAARRLPETKGE